MENNNDSINLTLPSIVNGDIDKLLDILLDENNHESIVLMDESGRQISFEQIALITLGVDEEKNAYVILKPIDKIVGINDNEAIVFTFIEDEEGEVVLRVEDDEQTITEVFNKFYTLFEDARKRKED